MLLSLFLLAAAAPTEGKTSALDDWHALTILEVGAGESGHSYLRVAAGDLDGDGVADQAVLRFACADGLLKQAHYTVTSPRDAASGQASGRRMHKPVTITKEWGPTTLQLRAMKPTYDVKTIKTARAAQAADGWSPITLAGVDGLCPLTEAAATTIIKSKSNITNN